MILRRPPKFSTAEDLRKAIQVYFDSRFDPEYVLDKATDERVEKTDDMGMPIMRQTKRLTVTDLAMALGLTRQGLINYQIGYHKSIPEEEKGIIAEYINQAKMIVQESVEDNLLDPNAKATGAIFNLKNNFQWEDCKKMELAGSLNIAQSLRKKRVERKDK